MSRSVVVLDIQHLARNQMGLGTSLRRVPIGYAVIDCLPCSTDYYTGTRTRYTSWARKPNLDSGKEVQHHEHILKLLRHSHL